jgi:anti-sigma B factor antagonist
MDNNVSVETRNDIGIIRCAGQIDYNAKAFKTAVNSFLTGGTFKIVVDFSGITFISSTGWGTIIGNLKEIRTGGGDIKLAAMSADVKKVYDLLEFYNLIDSSKTVEDAVKSFS